MKMEIIMKECPDCGKQTFIAVPTDNYKKYLKGCLVQDAFPEAEFTPVYREIITSGMCKECQDYIFGGVEK